MPDSTFDLSQINGQNGFVLSGSDATDRSSSSTAVADVNGDGFLDLIVGSNTAAPSGLSDAGRTTVLFGGSSPGVETVFTLNMNGVNGFNINGEAIGDESGFSVSSAGDFNNDGIDDLIIGAPDADPSANSLAGKAYIVYGQKTLPPNIDLISLAYIQGVKMETAIAGDRVGSSVNYAGDVNGDGISDVIVGAMYADPGGRSGAGISYVVFGSETGYVSTLDLTSLGSKGFALNGVTASDRSGVAVGAAGDVNGDGIDDLIIGADYADPGGRSRAGTAYVVYGRNTTFPANFELSSLDGTEGFAINGALANDRAGSFVGSAGDFNADGVDDLLIGAPGFTGLPGKGYIIYGKKTGFPSPFELSAMNATTGIVFNGITILDRTADSMAVCDVNGDGIKDVIIGAGYADPGGKSSAGKTYVVFGPANGIAPTFQLNSLDGTNGFTMLGASSSDTSGKRVLCFDFNNDGINDIITGGPQRRYQAAPQVGGSYVVYGTYSQPNTTNATTTITPTPSSSSTPPDNTSPASTLTSGLIDLLFGNTGQGLFARTDDTATIASESITPSMMLDL